VRIRIPLMVSETLIVGGLTFLGTGLATAAGFWQWQRAQAREARKEYRAQRIEALREVWEALADLEEEQRTSIMVRDAAAVAAGPEKISRVNLLLLRRAPFLRLDEQQWAQSFTHHVIEIDTMVRASMRDGNIVDVSWWMTSMQQPAEFSITAIAAQELKKLRIQLSDRYAAVVRGDLE
jgi:hypothetical protein